MNRFKKQGQSQLLLQTQMGNQANDKKNKSKTTISTCNKDIGIFKNIFVENSIIGSIKDSVHIPNLHVEEVSNPNYTPIKVFHGITIENNNNLEDNSLLTKIQIEELIDRKLALLLGKVENENMENLEENNNKQEEKCEDNEGGNIEFSITNEDKVNEDKNIEDRIDEITLEEKSIKSSEVKRGRRNYKKNQEEKILE